MCYCHVILPFPCSPIPSCMFVFIHFPVVLFNSLVALLQIVNGHFLSFSSPEKCEVCCSGKLVKNPKVFHWPYQGGNLTFIWRSPLSNWKLKIKNPIKIRKTQKVLISKSLLRVCLLRVLWYFVCFFYGPFCHGKHKLYLSTWFTTIFLWTSLPFILINISSTQTNVC